MLHPLFLTALILSPELQLLYLILAILGCCLLDIAQQLKVKRARHCLNKDAGHHLALIPLGEFSLTFDQLAATVGAVETEPNQLILICIVFKDCEIAATFLNQRENPLIA